MNQRSVHSAVVAGILLSSLVVPLVSTAQGTADGSASADQSAAQQPAQQSAQQPAAQPAQSAADAGTAPAATTQQSAPAPTPAPTSAGGSAAPQQSAQPSGGSGNSAPAPTAQPTAQPQVPQQPVQIDLGTATANVVNDMGTGSYLWAVLVGLALAIIPFGFLFVAWNRKKKPQPTKEEETKNRCMDIENLMKDKLRELTDLKAMAQEKTVEMGKELMRDLVTGTKTGDLLVRIEKAEEQYNKLKKLFEECQIDIDRYKYKGVLIENSLFDKKILKEVRVVRTRDAGEWILHDIRLSRKQIEDIQKDIVDSKWFFHLWEPRKDEVTVVFKDRIFTVSHSDRSTWAEAIKHGLLCGIPQSQLNFEIVQ